MANVKSRDAKNVQLVDGVTAGGNCPSELKDSKSRLMVIFTSLDIYDQQYLFIFSFYSYLLEYTGILFKTSFQLTSLVLRYLRLKLRSNNIECSIVFLSSLY